MASTVSLERIMASFVQNISPQPMLGCILEIIAVERFIRVTEAVLLMYIRRIPGFEQSLTMEIGVAEAQDSMLKVGRPCVGGDIIDGSDSRIKVPRKSTVTSSEVGKCKDAGSDDDDEDEEDEDDDEEDDLGDDEDDLSADEGGQDDKENNPDENEEGEEEANGNDEDDDEDEDEEDDGEEDEDEEDEDEEEEDEEDEEPPAKKKK